MGPIFITVIIVITTPMQLRWRSRNDLINRTARTAGAWIAMGRRRSRPAARGGNYMRRMEEQMKSLVCSVAAVPFFVAAAMAAAPMSDAQMDQVTAGDLVGCP